jgi:hypothetical protein
MDRPGLIRPRSDVSGLVGVSVELYLGDVRDPASLVAPVTNVDYVFHLAAELLATDREAIIEGALDGELTHHLEYPPGGAKLDDTTNHPNGTGRPC